MAARKKTAPEFDVNGHRLYTAEKDLNASELIEKLGLTLTEAAIRNLNPGSDGSFKKGEKIRIS